MKPYQFCDKCNRTFPMNHWGCLYCGGKLRVFEVECEPEQQAGQEVGGLEFPNFTINYLIYVKLEREWFYINGQKEMGFKTRGNNKVDLRTALFKYDIDFWESDFEQCTRDMAAQLYWQARKKHEPLKLEAIA
jgi:hypothetical protein